MYLIYLIVISMLKAAGLCQVRLSFLKIVSEPKSEDVVMGVLTAASATTITTTAAARTALLLLRLLLETRRFQAFVFKVTNPQPSLPCPQPLPCPSLLHPYVPPPSVPRLSHTVVFTLMLTHITVNTKFLSCILTHALCRLQMQSVHDP